MEALNMTQHAPIGKIVPSAEFPQLRRIKHFRPETLLTELLASQRRLPVIFFDPEGNILLINKYGALGYKKTPEELIGKNLRDVVVPEWGEERVEFIHRCITTDKPLAVMQICGGNRMVLRLVPIRAQPEDERPSCVLMTGESIRPCCYYSMLDEATDEKPVVHSKLVELGKLGVLSTRELEVLALMRQGMRSKDIAKHLHRSVSTIENHRDKIGIKLGLRDRSKIIELANIAVLQEEDAHRKRVNIFGLDVPKVE